MRQIGHGCLLRAATVENNCLVGMGSKLMEGSYMEAHSQLGMESLITQGLGLIPDRRVLSPGERAARALGPGALIMNFINFLELI